MTKAATLARAVLTYGTHAYPVTPGETSPLPVEFDFNNAEDCARRVFAVMSNASGGHMLRGCTLRVNRERNTANLTCNGAHVYYRDETVPKLRVEDIDRLLSTTEITLLGDVRTDQYGGGWKRAVWTASQS